MPNIKEIRDTVTPYVGRDGKPFSSNVVSIEEQLESQANGATGIGLNKKSFQEDQEDFNRAGLCNSTVDESHEVSNSTTPSPVSGGGGLPFLRKP